MAFGLLALSSISSSAAYAYAVTYSSNCDIVWEPCGNGIQSGAVTKEKFFGSDCPTVYGKLNIDESGTVAIRSCGTAASAASAAPSGTNSQGGGQSTSSSGPGGTASLGTSQGISTQILASGDFTISMAQPHSDGRTHSIRKSDVTPINSWGIGSTQNINSLAALQRNFPGVTKVRIGTTEAEITAVGTHTVYVKSTEPLPTTVNQILFV